MTQSSFKYDESTDTMTVSNLDIVSSANFNDNDITNVAITSGSISGTNVDMTNGTFTTTAAQKKTILEGAGSNIDFGNYEISANTVTSSSLTDGRVVFAGANGTLTDSNGLLFENDKIKSKIFAGLDTSGGSEQTGYIEIINNKIWFRGVLPETDQTRTLQDGGVDDYVFLTKAAADAAYARADLVGDDGLPI